MGLVLNAQLYGSIIAVPGTDRICRSLRRGEGVHVEGVCQRSNVTVTAMSAM